MSRDVDDHVTSTVSASTTTQVQDDPTSIPSLEALLSREELASRHPDVSRNASGPDAPPGMAEGKEHTADEVLSLMNKMPLFMTNLDDADVQDNIQLEAIRALAYEGTRAEIAGNFREQGNEAAKQKLWKDARAFYDKAIDTLRMSDQQLREVKGGDGPSEFEVLDVDEVEEAEKQKQILEASHANRALCNLEMKNYGSCNRDCAATLKLNPANVKAWYRSASACLALDKIAESDDACLRGLDVDPANPALKTLSTEIAKRGAHLAALQKDREARESRRRTEAAAIQAALRGRNIPVRSTTAAPDMEDATISLAVPADPASTLRIPTMLLYPLHEQTDFIKQFAEDESVGQHLQYIMPLPWDQGQEYTPESVDCYVQTTVGGLLKVGKKLALLRIFNSGKVEVLDSLLKIYVVPSTRATTWIETFKARTRRG